MRDTKQIQTIQNKLLLKLYPASFFFLHLTLEEKRNKKVKMYIYQEDMLPTIFSNCELFFQRHKVVLSLLAKSKIETAKKPRE